LAQADTPVRTADHTALVAGRDKVGRDTAGQVVAAQGMAGRDTADQVVAARDMADRTEAGLADTAAQVGMADQPQAVWCLTWDSFLDQVATA